MSASLLSGLGMVLVAAAACAAILLPPSGKRSAAMLVALALLPVLVLGDQWDTPRVADLRDSPERIAVGLMLGALVVAGLAALMRRHPLALPLGVAAALPFRVPLESGGDQANLLLPLYVVIVAGVVVTVLRADQPQPRPQTGWSARLPRLLAAFVGLYALQGLYSDDLSRALQDVCFFLVPFTIMFVLLRECEWDRRLLTLFFGVFVVEAVVFALFGFGELATRHLIWNPEVIEANQFHIYFRVNSLFWDPNIYGRYLSYVLIAVVGVLLWARDRRIAGALTLVTAILWLGLVTTYSLSSFAALLVGLAVLAAMRWSLRWIAAICGAGALVAVIAAFSVGLFDSTGSSGRTNLVEGGIQLLGNRPLQGYGSGSFATAYLQDVAKDGKAPVSESHTEPVTVAAEQGLIGLLVYLALIITALVVMSGGMRGVMPGVGGGSSSGCDTTFVIARACVLALFVTLLVHTLGYANFFEDPVTWILLALACSLPALPSREG